MSATTTVRCDGCPVSFTPPTPMHPGQARRAARAAGWAVSPICGGEDYCPTCWPIRRVALSGRLSR